MNPTFRCAIVLLALGSCGLPLLAVDTVAGEAALPVSFVKEVAPIFLKKCSVCHGPEKSKSGYQLVTFNLAMKAGSSKAAPITPGDPANSKLFQLITTLDEDDRMPQKDERLSAEQIARVEQWIKAGARFDGPDPNAPLLTLVPPAPYPLSPDVYPRPVPVTALAFSPDGRALAASGYHEVNIWNPENGHLERRIQRLPQRISALAYDSTGRRLVAAGGTPGQMGAALLLDPAAGVVLRSIATFPDVALCAALSPDGTRLAVGGADNAIHLYDTRSWKEQLRIEQHADWVMDLAFSPDGAQIASASRDRTARIYNATTGDLETTYTGHEAPVASVAFSPDAQTVFSAGRDRKIHAWATKDAKKRGEIDGFDGEVFRVLIQRDRLFACSADKSVRMYQLENHKLLRSYPGHSDWVYALAFDPKTQRLASGSFDGQVRVWNPEIEQPTCVFTAAPGFSVLKQETSVK